MLGYYNDVLKKMAEQGLKRELRKRICIELDFSSNDYLNLSKDPDVIRAGIDAANQYGAGATGSRLLSGNYELVEAFEAQIAADKNTDGALVFNSGFQANTGILASLLTKDFVLISDKLNHASIYQGAGLSKAEFVRYGHLDYTHLEDLLKEFAGKKIIIATETIFGMDGDVADLKTISYLAGKYGTMLLLDEAHATGIYGHNGYGLSTDFDLDRSRTIIMGTFSKALGSGGAYVACNKIIKDFLVTKCREFIYTTALPPFCIGAAYKSWELISSLDDRRTMIKDLAATLRANLRNAGYKVIGDGTNIVPVLFENTNTMLEKMKELEAQGIAVSGIRKPTSPTPRLRFAINASHTSQDIEKVRL